MLLTQLQGSYTTTNGNEIKYRVYANAEEVHIWGNITAPSVYSFATMRDAHANYPDSWKPIIDIINQLEAGPLTLLIDTN